MAASGVRALTDEQVRAIKINLIAGTSCAVLARMYRVSENTISRIRRGVNYQHIVVQGEEQLRPQVECVPMAASTVRVISGMSEEEESAAAEASLARLMQAGKAEAIGVDDEIVKAARGFLGNQAEELLPQRGEE